MLEPLTLTLAVTRSSNTPSQTGEMESLSLKVSDCNNKCTVDGQYRILLSFLLFLVKG